MRIGQLTTNRQFQCVTSSGHKAVTKSFVVFCLSNVSEQFGPRFDGRDMDTFVGFTVSRRNGNAVKRNRIKRRLRHVVREVVPRFEFLKGAGVVIIARPNARTEKYEDLSAEMQKVLNYLRKTVAAK